MWIGKNQTGIIEYRKDGSWIKYLRLKYEMNCTVYFLLWNVLWCNHDIYDDNSILRVPWTYFLLQKLVVIYCITTNIYIYIDGKKHLVSHILAFSQRLPNFHPSIFHEYSCSVMRKLYSDYVISGSLPQFHNHFLT